MKPISRETVDLIIDHFEAHDDTEMQQRFKRFSEQQPFLMAYLLAGDEEFVEEENRGDLLYLGLMIFEVLSGERGGLPKVGEDPLMETDERNMQMVMNLDEASEMHFQEAIERMLEGYNQQPLLTAMLEVLMSGNEDTPELAPESVGMNLIHLKTVIDSLDR